jgi:hypothetical protein
MWLMLKIARGKKEHQLKFLRAEEGNPKTSSTPKALGTPQTICNFEFLQSTAVFLIFLNTYTG